MSGRWRTWVLVGLGAATVIAAIYFPYLRRRVKTTAKIEQPSEEQARRELTTPPTASVRQLRTTAAPAIAVELSSVSVQDRSELDRMMPGVADAIARGLTAFRPSYVLPSDAGAQP